MLVAGDFNSLPGSPAHQLLVKGKVVPPAVVSVLWREGGGVAGVEGCWEQRGICWQTAGDLRRRWDWELWSGAGQG